MERNLAELEPEFLFNRNFDIIVRDAKEYLVLGILRTLGTLYRAKCGGKCARSTFSRAGEDRRCIQ